LLYLAHEKGINVIIAINDINQISTTTTLAWFPKVFPTRVKVILTVDSNGPQTGIVEALEEYKCSKLQLEPFNNVAKEDFVKQAIFHLLFHLLSVLSFSFLSFSFLSFRRFFLSFSISFSFSFSSSRS